MPRSRAIIAATSFRSGDASAWQIATASASAAWFGVGSACSAEDRLHHPLHLRLLGAAVAAHRLLDARGRVLGALDAGERASDEHGAARLPDGERDAGVCADERLLECDRIRRVLGDESRHALEDRLQTKLQPLAGRRRPPAVADGPEAAAAFLDDPVPAIRRPRIDADDLHEDTLGTWSDNPLRAPR